jgi:hypothetical protein
MTVVIYLTFYTLIRPGISINYKHRVFLLSFSRSRRLYRVCVESLHPTLRPVTAALGMQIVSDSLKADSHIACRAHAVPLPCRAAKGLECVFPI